MKAVSFVLMTAVFVLCLAAFYLVHAWFLPVNVILYSAALDALLAALVTMGIAFWLRARLRLTFFECVLMFFIWTLGGYAFAISGPTVLDRSLSFYILEKLQQRGGGIRRDAMEKVFVGEYIPEFRLMDVRMTEQLQSGTITIKDGCVMLTPRGAFIASVSHFIRGNLLPKKRLLDGVYTDTLTEPFAGSATGPQGYECQVK